MIWGYPYFWKPPPPFVAFTGDFQASQVHSQRVNLSKDSFKILPSWWFLGIKGHVVGMVPEQYQWIRVLMQSPSRNKSKKVEVGMIYWAYVITCVYNMYVCLHMYMFLFACEIPNLAGESPIVWYCSWFITNFGVSLLVSIPLFLGSYHIKYQFLVGYVATCS